MWLRAGFLGALLALDACRVQQLPVTLQGNPDELRAIAGDWSGEYVSNLTARSGSIHLVIRPGADSAFGDVIMLSERGEPFRAAEDPVRHQLHAPAMDVLRIAFVRVDGTTVSGALERYIAPDCDCAVSTTFIGTVKGDEMAGTYLTEGPSLEQRGRWSASRKR